MSPVAKRFVKVSSKLSNKLSKNIRQNVYKFAKVAKILPNLVTLVAATTV